MTKTQRGAVTSIHEKVFGGWEQWIFLVSDNHFDSIYCNREKMRADFDEAKRRMARICIFGDWFDAMQGRFDPRRSMAELRPEYRREDYYDYVVNDSADWLAPYATQLDCMADGNHELSVLKSANTNLMERLVVKLNERYGGSIQHGGYGGWLRWMLDIGGVLQSVRIRYFHGAGGEAPVTRGAIQTNRQAVYLPDANVIVNGHSHNNYHIPISRERLSNKGIQYFDLQHHIRTPGYKQSYGDGSTGWDVTRGGVPKPIGGVFVKLFVHGDRIGITIDTSAIEAPIPVSVNTDELYGGKIFDDDQEGA